MKRITLFRLSLIPVAAALIYTDTLISDKPGVCFVLALIVLTFALVMGSDRALVEEWSETQRPAGCAHGPTRLCGAADGCCTYPRCVQ